MAHASHKKRKAGISRAPIIIVELQPELAPGKLSAEKLAALFLRAWTLASAKYRATARGEKQVAVDIHLVSDAEISKLNQTHMKHAGPTDVLSFPMGESDPERGAFNLGEIVASVETAQREAAARSISIEEELSRYCVHGFLHLLGYDDDTPARTKEMFAVQEKALRQK